MGICKLFGKKVRESIVFFHSQLPTFDNKLLKKAQFMGKSHSKKVRESFLILKKTSDLRTLRKI